MNKTTPIRTSRHVVYALYAHFVFVAKYRHAVFTKNMLEFMQSICSDVCQSFGAELLEFNGEKDHVHLMIQFPPKLAISKLANSLKGVTSRHLRKRFSKDIEKFYFKGVLWSPSYFVASCGGAPLKIIQDYIQKQLTPK